MIILQTEFAAHAGLLLGAESLSAEADAAVPLADDALAACLADVLQNPAEARSVSSARVALGWANTHALLTEVHGRKFAHGIFLAPSVLAAAEDYRRAVAVLRSGQFVPTLVCTPHGEARAQWRPLAAGTPFFVYCVDQLARRAGRTPLETGGQHETAEDAWLAALRADTDVLDWGRAAASPEEAAARAAAAADLSARVDEWLAPLAVGDRARAVFRFTLVPPAQADGAWRLTYPSPETRLACVALGQAIRLFPPLGAETFRKTDAEEFVRTGAARLAAAGFAVELPAGLSGEHLTAEADLQTADETLPEAPRAARTVRAHLTIRVDGEVVDAEEIEFLLDQHSPLVFFRDRWIEVDRNILKEALRALRDTEGRRLSVHEAVAFFSGARRLGALKIAEARAHGWLRGLVNELRGGAGFSVLPPPDGFCGTLRDYQARGYSWLAFLTRWGFGPCLADDMGLGKTVQTLAWVLHWRATHPESPPVLIVAPVSVTTNWARECAKFAPSLPVYLHQGPARATGAAFARVCRRAAIVLTGYSLLVHDFNDFRRVSFAALVLDEAQRVKNPATHAARAARALDAPVRLALTGTPLENSVADLWSIEDFLNPGLLGGLRDFLATFGPRLSRGAEAGAAAAAARKLRHALAPFMLRRLKSDPAVAAELGAKREVREYCTLSAEQRRAYEEALARFRAGADASDAPQRRRGRVLALLTELKQICDGEGKTERLEALLEEIFAAGESALLFTQYVRVARRIRERLAEIYGRRFPFLHGGLSATQREAEIAAFNTDPAPSVFLISLKAGGFGINLTRATHVIHFDRWWNPAVENQATDRAHRLGQTRTVFVHLMIAAGTLEDRIDALLEDKRRLAGEVVGSGEAFLAQMSEREFERTVRLA